MAYVLVKVDTRKIIDWPTFHSVFSEAFGFPRFYGQNMDAWIDCMTYLDDPDAGMSQIHAPMGGVVVLQLENVKDFAQRCSELYAAIIECSAFVNFRRIELGEEPILALSFAD
jgi:RNAse (barnase) inhibitor barstar